MSRSALGILLKRGLGLVLFLFVVLCVNILSGMFSSKTLQQAAGFLNNNIGIIVIATIIFATAEIFLLFRFPMNLPGPAFNAAGSVLIVTFIIRVFGYLDAIIGMKIFGWLDSFAIILYILVPLIVLIVGYAEMIQKPKQKTRLHRIRKNK